jgi:hypothetical protein
MIVAMGTIDGGGTTIYQGYNITSSTYNVAEDRYEIELTGFEHEFFEYVTVVSPHAGNGRYAGYASLPEGQLGVYISDEAGNPIISTFSFMVLDPTP